jgi:hypothetical protein
MGLRRCRTLAVLLAVLAGCATSPVERAPLTGPAPDVRGTWTGTWAGRPVSVVVIEQRDIGPGEGGVYLGSWQVLGDRAPHVSGVMTLDGRDGPVSTGVRGWLYAAPGGFGAVLEAQPGDGVQRLSLRSTAEGRLTGRGTSSFPWGPEGPVELVRTAAPAAAR